MIFITGFHHSGTSLLARTVEMMGFRFGTNIDRHHEHEDLKKVDDGFIGNWMHPVTNFHFGNIEVPADIDAYKNPRLMVTAPAWHNSFPMSHWIHITRDPYDVAIDIMDEKERPQDPRFWIELQEKYAIQFALFCAVSRPNLLNISYDKLCGYPDFSARLIASFLGKPERGQYVADWAKQNYRFQTYKVYL